MPTTSSHPEAASARRRTGKPDRRGSLYVPVLGVALIVASIGMSAMVVARLNLRSVRGRLDLREARMLADAAVELGMAAFSYDADWRGNLANDVDYPASPLTLGNGEIKWRLIDDDGDLADDSRDPVRLVGVATVGQAISTKSVLLEPAGAGLSCLEASLHSNGDFWMWNFVTVATDQFVSTNGSIYTNGSGVISGDAEAVGSIANNSVSGTATSGITARRMPNAQHVFDYYMNNGTWIDIGDLPGISPKLLENTVLSPGNNPYGSRLSNSQGIYVIDCKGQDIRVKAVRLVGTLVLLNTGSNSDLDNDQNWMPVAPNFPVLMVDGDITFNWHGEHTLRESLMGVNYNPPHTPYLDDSDTDQIDEYPGLIKGLIYVSGYLDVQHQCVIEGVVVTETVNPQASMNLTYDPTFLNNPPPGFRNGSGGGSGPEQQWVDQDSSNSGNGSNYTLGNSTGVGTYFAPSLPADAMSWSVTRVQIYTNDANSTGTFDVRVTKADGAQKPAAVLDSVTVQETSLPGTFDWYEIQFSAASGLQPAEAACLVIVANTNAGARIKFGTGSSGSPQTHFLSTVDGGGTWTIDTSQDLWIKIWGTYTTSSGSVEISPGSWRREASN